MLFAGSMGRNELCHGPLEARPPRDLGQRVTAVGATTRRLVLATVSPSISNPI